MELSDIVFSPHNDMSTEDIGIVKEHDSLIKQKQHANAAVLLKNNGYSKGFRASLFQALESRLNDLGVFLLNEFAANADEYYSTSEPTDEQMADKKFWIQIYN